MSILAQIQMFFKVKANSVMDNMEDPRQTLEYAYTQQQEMLRKVKQGLLEVATSRRQVEFQAKKLRERLPQLDEQAQRALAAGREDLARIALQRKQSCLTELTQLDRQAAEIAEEERKLTAAERQFSSQVDAFRTRRESLAARYTAAEAQVNITESLSGISSNAATIGTSIERAESKIGRMQARASALDALMESGTLSPISGGDAIERELNQMAANQAVEEEMAALKAKLNPVVKSSVTQNTEPTE